MDSLFNDLTIQLLDFLTCSVKSLQDIEEKVKKMAGAGNLTALLFDGELSQMNRQTAKIPGWAKFIKR